MPKRSRSASSTRSTSRPRSKKSRRGNVDISKVNAQISKYETAVKSDEESNDLKKQVDNHDIYIDDLEDMLNKHNQEDSQLLDLGSRGNASEQAVKNVLILNYLQEMLDSETQPQPSGQVEFFDLDGDYNQTGPDFNQKKKATVKYYKSKLSKMGVRGF